MRFISVFNILRCLLFIIVLAIVPLTARDQSRSSIPSSRLMNDEELLVLFDSSAAIPEKLRIELKKSNTKRSITAIEEYLSRRKEPLYFFSNDNIALRMNEFKRNYARETVSIIKRADDYIRIYGKNVDWKQPGKDMMGRSHTPNTIRYLARQARAVDLAKAYYLQNKDVEYIDHLFGQIKDFVNDYENGQTETGRNDVFERFYAGHRVRNWLFAHQLLKGSETYSVMNEVYMLKVFLLHGARLYESCREFHWGNHQLHGLAGLYEMTMMYPELPIMRFWNTEALRVIMEHIEREIKEDGFQFERASHYFKLDILNYFRIRRISILNQKQVPALFERRFHKMFDAIVALSKPNLDLPVLQDAQEKYKTDNIKQKGYTTALPSNDVAELADPSVADFMAIGALLYDNPRYKYFTDSQFPARFYWFFHKNVRDLFDEIDYVKPDLGSTALKASHYYVMRSGWDIEDYYMVIDGGLAQHKPDHTHGGILGISAYAFGEDILPNYRVRYSDPSYRTMKNSLVKNVALVDNIPQGQGWVSNHARTGFGIWDSLPKPTVHKWLSGDKFDYFSASHDRYNSMGVLYTRSIIFFKPDCWVIIDKFSSKDYHNYQQIWQGEYIFDAQYNRALHQDETLKFHILQADPSRMEVSERINFWTRSLQFEKQNVQDYAFITALYPLHVNSETEPDIRLFERSSYKQVVVFAGQKKHVFYFRKKEVLVLDEVSTNGEFVAVEYDQNDISSILLINGSCIEMEDFSFKYKNKTSAEFIRESGDKWDERIFDSY